MNLLQNLNGVAPAKFSYIQVDKGKESLLLGRGGKLPALPSTVVPKRRSEFYSGRWCASTAIKELFGYFDMPSVNADRSPFWPKGVIGSISHTDEWALALVGDCSEVARIGIDLESISAVSEVDNVQQVIATNNEQLMFELDKRQDLQTLIFSAKETLFKALYPKVQQYFDYLDAEVLDMNANRIEFRLLKDLGLGYSKNQRFGVNYRIGDGHVLTWQIDLN